MYLFFMITSLFLYVSALNSAHGVMMTEELRRATIAILESETSEDSLRNQVNLDACRFVKFYRGLQIDVEHPGQRIKVSDIDGALLDILQSSTDSELGLCCTKEDERGLRSWANLRLDESSSRSLYSVVLKQLAVVLEGGCIARAVPESKNPSSEKFDFEGILSNPLIKSYSIFAKKELAEKGAVLDRPMLAIAVTAILGRSIGSSITSEEYRQITAAYNFLDHIFSKSCLVPCQDSSVTDKNRLNVLRELFNLATDNRKIFEWTYKNFAGLASYGFLREWLRVRHLKIVERSLDAALEKIQSEHRKQILSCYESFREPVQLNINANNELQSRHQQYVEASGSKYQMSEQFFRVIRAQIVEQALQHKNVLYQNAQQEQNAQRLALANQHTLLMKIFDRWRSWSRQQENSKKATLVAAVPGSSSSSSSYVIRDESSDRSSEGIDALNTNSARADQYVSRRGIGLGLPYWLSLEPNDARHDSPQSFAKRALINANDLRGPGLHWHAPDGAIWWVFMHQNNHPFYRWRSADRVRCAVSYDGFWWWVYPDKSAQKSDKFEPFWKHTTTNL